jgi:hypothetical protein
MGSYRERLLVPVGYWLVTFPMAVLFGSYTYFFVGGFLPPLVMLLLFAVLAAFLVNWSSATIEVTGPALRAGRDTLPLRDATDVVALDERQSTLLRGPKADPAAYILLRPYLKRAVYIGLADQAGGVPYWLIATRHPDELAAAIERAREAGGDEAGGDEAGGHGTGHRESVG